MQFFGILHKRWWLWFDFTWSRKSVEIRNRNYCKTKLQLNNMPGIDPNLIVGKVNKVFLCKSCNLIARNPLECPECGDIYCSSCSLKNNQQCQNDQYVLAPLNKFLMRIYNNLEVKNPYDNDKIISISSYISYLAQLASKKRSSFSDLKVSIHRNLI